MSKKDETRVKETTIEGIKEIIEKSGYVLEIDTADLLRNSGWDVFFQYPYHDKKEGKLRKADLLGFRQNVFVESIKNFNLPKMVLVIECKKSTKHGWAFHTIKKEGSQVLVWLLGDIFKRFSIKTATSSLTSLSPSSNVQSSINDIHMFRIETRIGTMCCIPPKHPDDFNEALNQVLSDITWVKEEFSGCAVFPVIVFDGPMWEFFKENGELKVKNIDYLQYLSTTIEKNSVSPYLIDIVNSSYFPTFLPMLNKTIEVLSAMIRDTQ